MRLGAFLWLIFILTACLGWYWIAILIGEFIVYMTGIIIYDWWVNHSREQRLFKLVPYTKEQQTREKLMDFGYAYQRYFRGEFQKRFKKKDEGNETYMLCVEYAFGDPNNKREIEKQLEINDWTEADENIFSREEWAEYVERKFKYGY